MGHYTGIDDVEILFSMVLDDNFDTEKRVLAVIDLSLDESFDWHRLLNFVSDTTKNVRVRCEIFDKQTWDERATPTILAAIREDNPEIQFWATFALTSNRWDWQADEIDTIISTLDDIATSEIVAETMWHIGRETLLALETAYQKQANFDEWRANFYMISPRLEYWDFMLANQQNEIIPQPTLKINPEWFKQELITKFENILFDTRQPKAQAYVFDFHIDSGENVLYGALHQDKFALILNGDTEQVQQFAQWYRTIIPTEHELRLYTWADEGHIIE